MKTPVICDGHHVFGIYEEPKPIRTTIPGKQRLRFRPGEFVLLRIRTPDGIREFILEDKGDHWAIKHETGRNLRLKGSPIPRPGWTPPSNEKDIAFIPPLEISSKYRIITNGVSFKIQNLRLVGWLWWTREEWVDLGKQISVWTWVPSTFDTLEEAQKTCDTLIELDCKTHDWRPV